MRIIKIILVYVISLVSINVYAEEAEKKIDIAAWLKRYPVKCFRYNMDRSYGYMWINRYSYDWQQKFYYRYEWDQKYDVSYYNYSLYWRIGQRWGVGHPTQLAEATFGIDYTPMQKYFDQWWGNQHKYHYKNIYLETWWKVVSRLGFGLYLQSNSSGWDYNEDYVASIHYVGYRGTGTAADPYRHIKENEWGTGTGNYYGYYSYLADHNIKYNRIGFGLKWYGYNYYDYYVGKSADYWTGFKDKLDPKPKYPK